MNLGRLSAASLSLTPPASANPVSTGAGHSTVTDTSVPCSSERTAWLYESTNAFEAP